jgi:O-antigen/teichoic acid export membrane protein
LQVSNKEEKASYRQIMKATSIFGGVQVFNIAIAIIRSKAIAILLGPAGMGIAGLLTSTTGLIRSLTNFGLGTSAVKDIAEAHKTGNQDRIAKVAAVFRRLVWLTGLLGAGLTLMLSPWLSELTFGNKDYTWSFIFLSITLLLGQLTAGQKVILQGTRKLKYLASANMIGAVLSLVITLPLYYFYGLEGIVPAIIIMGFATFFVAVYFGKKVTIPKTAVTKETIVKEGKGMLKLGFMLSLSSLITTLVAYLIRIYISNTGSVDDVGLYAAGFNIIGTYVGLVFTAMGTDYYPRLSGVANDNNKRNTLVNQQGEIAILILFPIILVFVVFIPFIVQLLYSTKFLPINNMIIWAAFAMFFKAGSWAIAFQFLAKGSSKLYFVNELIVNIYLLGFNILGYSYYGLTGLGYSFLITYILYAFQVYVITRHYYQYAINGDFFKTFILAISVSAVCLALALQASEIYKYIFGSMIILGGSIFSIYQLNQKTGILSIIKWPKK